MAQFSTNEAVSLEKRIDSSKKLVRTSSAEIDNVYEINRCVEWIRSNDLKKVCLQFPDYLLPDSCEVTTRLQNQLGQTVYLMGDSAYESCCVDYVTAQHVESDGIIHFGPKCLSKWTDVIPCLCVYEKGRIDLGLLESNFLAKFAGVSERITVIVDTPFIYKVEEMQKILGKHVSVEVIPVDSEIVKVGDGITVYVGANNRKLMNFHLIFKPAELYYYDPEETEPSLKSYRENNVILKRRRFLIEKIKDGRTFGIIIGTLVIKNFIGVIDRIKRLLKLNNKTYYIVSVGRPTVAKLANFPEMDMYVLICCSMSDIYDSRDFYKPIVTPHDVEIALNPDAVDSNFSYDFSLQQINASINEDHVKSNLNAPDVSLLTGSIRSHEEHESSQSNDEKQVVLRNVGTVALNEHAGAGFLAGRSFKGLEQKLGQTEVKVAEEGRKGIAQHYENETF